jgi:hypothetical protein
MRGQYLDATLDGLHGSQRSSVALWNKKLMQPNEVK